MSALVHIAGNDIRIGRVLRQRCAWCGTALLDYDLTRVAAPEGQDPTPATWPPGRLIEVDGNLSALLPDTGALPANACDTQEPTP